MRQNNTQQNNQKKVQLVLFLILIFNFLVAAMKMIVGTIISSSSMVSDGFHSLSDGSSNIIGIVGIRLASKDVDNEHPYGHEKIEIIASLIVGFMLVIIGLKVVYSSITKHIAGQQPYVTKQSLVVMLITLVINIIVVLVEKDCGRKLNSSFLITDANHTKSDIFVTLGVLLTLTLIKLGAPVFLDVVVSLFVAAVIFKTAYEVLSENGNILIDAKSVNEDDVISILNEFKEVKRVHKIRSRGTKTRIFIDMHIHVDPNMSVKDAHCLEHNIDNAIKANISDCAETTIHIEPE